MIKLLALIPALFLIAPMELNAAPKGEGVAKGTYTGTTRTEKKAARKAEKKAARKDNGSVGKPRLIKTHTR